MWFVLSFINYREKNFVLKLEEQLLKTSCCNSEATVTISAAR